ncbi:unnamed protein product [Citrullus colocynthis]|uniref:Uncharacterized protein n=1 Tax=Citrullus colocynthis TaxID=252529 RepID=A0ABP0YVJ3_9ROSI
MQMRSDVGFNTHLSSLNIVRFSLQFGYSLQALHLYERVEFKVFIFPRNFKITVVLGCKHFDIFDHKKNKLLVRPICCLFPSFPFPLTKFETEWLKPGRIEDCKLSQNSAGQRTK